MSANPLRAAAIANEFLDRSSRESVPLTPMQLLKLVYISHGWHLAVTGGEPLFSEPVEAWKNGPVIHQLYHQFREYGRLPIEKLAYTADADGIIMVPFVSGDDSNKTKLLDWVWKNYGAMSGPQLSNLTHEPGTPWWEARQAMMRKNVEEGRPKEDWIKRFPIDNETIRKHYVDLWKKRHG